MNFNIKSTASIANVTREVQIKLTQELFDIKCVPLEVNAEGASKFLGNRKGIYSVNKYLLCKIDIRLGSSILLNNPLAAIPQVECATE